MKPAYSITDNALIKAGHRLLCVLFAAYDFPIFYRDDDPDPLDSFRQFEDQDISENLLTLAAIARACDDEMSNLSELETVFPEGVGWLQQEYGNKIILTVREACNKVIHAKSVEYDLAWSDENPLWHKWYKSQGHEVSNRYKTPAIKLTGLSKSGKSWVARVELVPFILAASMWDMCKWKFA